MLTFGRETSQAPIPVAAPREKVDAWVGGLDLYARHAVMLAEVAAGEGEDAEVWVGGDGRKSWRSGV